MRKGLLYHSANGEQDMNFRHHYTIHCFFPKHHYIGAYLGCIQGLFIFENVERVYPDDTEILIGPKCFSTAMLFKRIVYESEQKKAYRDAFEKRAVNQIIGSIVGHAGAYY